LVTSANSAELRAARAQLVRHGARLVDDGLAVGRSGNLSVRCADLVAITPSGIGYHEMSVRDIAVVGLDGTEVDAPERPSSETPMHLAVYRATAALAVVHTHSPEVIALSASRGELPAIHYAITELGGPVQVVPYLRFGSAGLATAAAAALGPQDPGRPTAESAGGRPRSQRMAAILRNHGAITTGDSLEQAYQRAVLLEWLARVFRLALAYGEPHILSPAELDEVADEAARRGYGTRRGPHAR
jgi:L-fuculose-phosphate aldolase